MNSNMNSGSMGDKETVNDFIASQKLISRNYDVFAFECVNPQLRSDFLNILEDEHSIQVDLYNEMNARGWYPTTPADANMIAQTRQKFSGQQ